MYVCQVKDPKLTADELEQRGGEWYVMSEQGEELSGPYASREEAAERLRQIEAAKAAKGKDADEKDAAVAVEVDACLDRMRESSDVMVRMAAGLKLVHLWDAAEVERMDGHRMEARRYDFGLGALHMDRARPDGIFMEETDEGFLRGAALFARTGVQQYSDADGNRWGEYRDASEVFAVDSLRSYDLAVMTNNHPAEFVTIKNRDGVDVGSIGTDARPYQNRFVRASLVIRDAETIREIKAGKRDLSMGYTATVVVQNGVAPDGTPYRGRQTGIRINHGAVVDQGRAGPECGLELVRGDAFTVLTDMETNPMRKIKLADGTEVEVPAEVADVYEQCNASVTIGDVEFRVPQAVADALTSKTDDQDRDQDDEREDTDTAELRATVDMLKAREAEHEATFNARVDARSSLVTNARAVLGPEHTTDGASDADLMRAIVLKVQPNMEGRLDANKVDAGYLRCAYEQALELHSKRDVAVEDTNRTIFGVVADGGKDPFVEVLTHYDSRAKRVAG